MEGRSTPAAAAASGEAFPSSLSSSSSSAVSLCNSSSLSTGVRQEEEEEEEVSAPVAPSLVYSSRDLKALRDVPASRSWPSFLDGGFVNANSGLWDPHSWHRGSKKSDEEEESMDSRKSTPPPPTTGSNHHNSNASSNATEKSEGSSSLSERRKEDWRALPPSFDLPLRKDVKERLKDVGGDDGIILSPQRRSFLSGCQAPLHSSSNSHQEEILNKSNAASSRRMDLEDREDLMGGKRWSGRSSLHHHHHHHHHGNSHHSHHPVHGNGGGHHHVSVNSNKRYGRQDYHHMRRHHKETEPEWMSASISHGDVMELKGFDDDEAEKQQRREEKAMMNGSGGASSKKGKNGKGGTGPTSSLSSREPLISAKKDSDPAPSTKSCDPLQIMDILDLSQMPDFSDSLLPDAMSNGSETTKKESRFSKFFQNRNQETSSPPLPTTTAAQTVSVQQQQQSIQQQSSQLPPNPSRTLIRIPSPGDSNNYFAPISPAAPTKSEQLPRRTTATSGAPPPAASLPNSLMEMLRLGGQNENGKAATIPQGKEVEEETVSKGSAWNAELPPHIQSSFTSERPEEKTTNTGGGGDLSAFKKFAALVQGSHQDNNLPQSLRHHPQPLPPHLQAPGFGLLHPSPIPANAPTENDILSGHNSNNGQSRYPSTVHPQRPRGFPPQFQQQQPQQRYPPNMGVPPELTPVTPPPPNFFEILQVIQHIPFSPDILKRSEVQVLQSGLARGEITHSMLIQQLSLGNLSPLRRLIVLNVLKVEQMSGKLVLPTHLTPTVGHGMMPFQMASTPPPHHLASGDALLSALKCSSNGDAVNHHHHHSSPPMEQHGSSGPHVMPPSLHRKKVEERESSKKTEEGSPLVFTPTVVIKRMAADRRDSDPKPSEPPKEEGTFKRLFGQTTNNNHSSNNNNSMKEEGLSRFFTPDVLAQASSGNMPSMPPLPTKKALTLEELENLQLV